MRLALALALSVGILPILAPDVRAQEFPPADIGVRPSDMSVPIDLNKRENSVGRRPLSEIKKVGYNVWNGKARRRVCAKRRI
jgi:hypothetical protein